MRLKLEPPSLAYKNSYLTGLDRLKVRSEIAAWVYLGDSADFDAPKKDFSSYVDTLLRREHAPPPGFVRDSVYWAISGGIMVGRISLRHALNDFLKQVGGHIGYITHPDYRGQGVATEMLRQILQTDRAKSIGRLLLTCDVDNLASIRTIEKNGGKFAGIVAASETRPPKNHYWIELR
jgi:predicted acetyltransferase